jgi:hypothetical protein
MCATEKELKIMRTQRNSGQSGSDVVGAIMLVCLIVILIGVIGATLEASFKRDAINAFFVDLAHNNATMTVKPDVSYIPNYSPGSVKFDVMWIDEEPISINPSLFLKGKRLYSTRFRSVFLNYIKTNNYSVSVKEDLTSTKDQKVFVLFIHDADGKLVTKFFINYYEKFEDAILADRHAMENAVENDVENDVVQKK